MDEYIDREALLKAVSGWRILVKDLYDCGYDDCITAIEDTVSDAPSAKFRRNRVKETKSKL